MDYDELDRLRRKAVVEFLDVVSVAVVVNDTMNRGYVSSEEFLRMIDVGMARKLEYPVNADVAAIVRDLRDVFRTLTTKNKSRGEMAEAVEEVYRELDLDFDW